MAGNEGAEFTSFTITTNVFASLMGGEPLSVTRTVILLVAGPWDSDGIQVKTPPLALTAAPAGAPASRLNVSVLDGRSGSVAVTVNESNVPSFTVRFVIAPSTGAEFVSLTVTIKVFVSL